MKKALVAVIAVIVIGVVLYLFQVTEKDIGIYKVYYYSNRCNPDTLPYDFSQLTKTPCVNKILWPEQIGVNVYRWMRWTPDTGTKEGSLERK